MKINSKKTYLSNNKNITQHSDYIIHYVICRVHAGLSSMNWKKAVY